jgi:hypothetical protein
MIGDHREDELSSAMRAVCQKMVAQILGVEEPAPETRQNAERIPATVD